MSTWGPASADKRAQVGGVAGRENEGRLGGLPVGQGRLRLCVHRPGPLTKRDAPDPSPRGRWPRGRRRCTTGCEPKARDSRWRRTRRLPARRRALPEGRRRRNRWSPRQRSLARALAFFARPVRPVHGRLSDDSPIELAHRGLSSERRRQPGRRPGRGLRPARRRSVPTGPGGRHPSRSAAPAGCHRSLSARSLATHLAGSQ